MKATILAMLATFTLAAFSAEKVDVAKAEELIAKKCQLLDVRTEREWNEGHLDKATRIEIGTDAFDAAISKALEKDKPVLIYCHSGGRSARAAKQLEAMGFKQVFDLKGGITAWKAAQKQVVK